MTILDRLQRRFGRLAVPHVSVALIAGQVVFYVVQYGNKGIWEQTALMPKLVLQGQLWRLLSFLLHPPLTNPLFAFFFWYLFYLMGTVLEQNWGSFRYNVFLLIGYLATVGASFVTPDAAAHNGFLYGSVFLAFAFLYPDFQLMLFFLLPVKIKWLALLAWIGYFLAVAFGPWPIRLATLASISNFLLFFGRDILLRIKAGHRRMRHRAGQISSRDEPRHECRVCGLTERTAPGMSFRYCSKCAGTCCYCEVHLRDHEHVTADEEADAARG